MSYSSKNLCDLSRSSVLQIRIGNRSYDKNSYDSQKKGNAHTEGLIIIMKSG
jgi:hypothetical protein